MKCAVVVMALGAWMTPGGASADFSVGMRALTRGDIERAEQEFREGAEAGEARSARALGGMLERGVDIVGGQRLAARPPEAAQWYRKAAEMGDQPSARLLATMLVGGRGAPRDIRQALDWFRKAGVDVDKQLQAMTDMPAEEAEDMLAWQLAIGSAFDRLRVENSRRQKWSNIGTLVVTLDAKTGKATAIGAADSAAGIFWTGVAERVLELAAPTPGAVRRGDRFEITIQFE